MKWEDTSMVTPTKWHKTICISLILVLLAVFSIALPQPAKADPVPSTISIAAPGNFDFVTFTVNDDNTASSANGTVTYSQGSDNSTGWQVTAKDNNTVANTGHMLRTGDSHALTGELQISRDVGSTYCNASGSPSTLTYTGSASGEYSFIPSSTSPATSLRAAMPLP